MQLSKNIRKTINLLNNADKTYNSLTHVSAEMKRLLIKATYLTNLYKLNDIFIIIQY